MGLSTVIAESSLKNEARGRFDLVSAIVGYFDRNPALYYEMRLKRLELGKSDSALQWMQRKKTPMLLMGDKVTKDDLYRHYPNLGTCLILINSKSDSSLSLHAKPLKHVRLKETIS